MWVMTQHGFYSAIAFDPKKGKLENALRETDPEDVLQVRCRVQGDAVHLAKFVGRPKAVRESKGRGDYEFRVNVTREEWVAFLAEETAEVDYGNFKSRVQKAQGKKRHDAYSRCWSALLSLQKTAPWSGYRSRRYEYPDRKARSVQPPLSFWDPEGWDEGEEWLECTTCSVMFEASESPDEETCEDCADDAPLHTSIHDLTEDEFRTMMEEAP